MESSMGLQPNQTGSSIAFRPTSSMFMSTNQDRYGCRRSRVVAAEIRDLIEARGKAVGIFASAPSQNEFLAALGRNSRH